MARRTRRPCELDVAAGARRASSQCARHNSPEARASSMLDPFTDAGALVVGRRATGEAARARGKEVGLAASLWSPPILPTTNLQSSQESNEHNSQLQEDRRGCPPEVPRLRC